MNDIDMSAEEVAQLKATLNYDPETGIFTWLRGVGGKGPGKVAGCVKQWGYVLLAYRRVRFSAHRLAWFMSYGRWPNGQIDHIDGNKANNAIRNLREVTGSQNQLLNNRPRIGNRSGLIGAAPTRCGRYFRAQIRVNGAMKYLGQFDTAEEAHAAYMKQKLDLLREPGLHIHGIASPQEDGGTA